MTEPCEACANMRKEYGRLEATCVDWMKHCKAAHAENAKWKEGCLKAQRETDGLLAENAKLKERVAELESSLEGAMLSYESAISALNILNDRSPQ
jgi:hypothetical protein